MARFDALIALVAVLFFATVVGGKLGKHSSAKAHMHALACCFHGLNRFSVHLATSSVCFILHWVDSVPGIDWLYKLSLVSLLRDKTFSNIIFLSDLLYCS